jgi:hypothetical protein
MQKPLRSNQYPLANFHLNQHADRRRPSGHRRPAHPGRPDPRAPTGRPSAS